MTTATLITESAITGGTWTHVAEFWVPGEPIPQPRPRARIMGHHAQIYTPSDHPVNSWKAAVRSFAGAHVPDLPLVGPVRVDWFAYFPRPKYMTVRKYGSGAVPHIKVPDEDNLTKSVLDSMTPQGWWKNDSQCWSGPREKYYHAVGGSPGMKVVIWSLQEQPGLLGGLHG